MLIADSGGIAVSHHVSGIEIRPILVVSALEGNWKAAWRVGSHLAVAVG